MKRKASLLIIFITVFIDLIGFGIIIPLLPYYGIDFGATPFVIGWLFTSYSLAQFIFAPIWGRLSDRIGRRPILLLGLFGSGFSYLIFAMAPSLLWMFLSRSFAGICGATVSTATAYITDITPEEKRAKGMGMIGAAFGLGFILGPAIGGMTSQNYSNLPLLIAAGICLINFLLAIFLLPESLPKEKRSGKPTRRFSFEKIIQILKIPKLGGMMLLYFLFIFAFSNYEATFSLFGKFRFDYSARTISYLFMYLGVLIVLMQGYLIGKLVKKFGENIILKIGMILMIIGLITMPLSTSTSMLLFLLIFVAWGNGINFPTINSIISKLAPEGEKGLVMGFSQSMGSLARILGPLTGGFLFQYIGIQSPYWLGAGVMGIALILSFFFLPKAN